ncbi:MAG TPA: ATP-dependent sacrificial sulfur transferase LarE [Acidimicrobiales bacterium]|nr:ATP-dependent sacrificial sulfur transferase LarE [Acidimicrobiales bacterium]
MTPGRGNLDVLRGILRDHGDLVVAYSGGADSAFLAAVAHQVLRDRMVAVTAVSPSLAASEREDAAAFAAERGFRHVEVETDEVERAAYRANDGDRCFWCKDALMDAVGPLAAELGAAVALGVNLDDLGEHRPGQRAASARGAVFPLVDAGFSKADVRARSKALGLRTWDKPAAPCLASRVPYGTEVTVAVLSKVERAEAALRAMGFDELRVRHGDGAARIEVPVDRLGEVAARHQEVVAAVRAAGYDRVTLDLEGLRSGNLNRDL